MNTTRKQLAAQLHAQNRFYAGKTKQGAAWLRRKRANRLAALALKGVR